MKILPVLEKLGYAGKDLWYGPGGGDEDTYEMLALGWPEENPPLSGLDVFESTWAEIVAEEKDEEYIEQREFSGYALIPNQLDMLYWDVSSGVFGDEAKNSAWFLHCSGVKEQFPKP
ncbi:uncharacterized protein METZ01_LOCUS447333 [marine metagenome]|uniref:Uncharacterized protein n=1 Tax=marine metagenome TaxID=408172 RepID=A0A382ZH00_9ZZZZ